MRSLFGLEGAAALAALRMDAALAGGASAPKAAMLDSDERARLARNDARIDTEREMPVSYTHLDVYKRQD